MLIKVFWIFSSFFLFSSEYKNKYIAKMIYNVAETHGNTSNFLYIRDIILMMRKLKTIHRFRIKMYQSRRQIIWYKWYRVVWESKNARNLFESWNKMLWFTDVLKCIYESFLNLVVILQIF